MDHAKNIIFWNANVRSGGSPAVPMFFILTTNCKFYVSAHVAISVIGFCVTVRTLNSRVAFLLKNNQAE